MATDSVTAIVLEDSGVFSLFAASQVRSAVPDAEVLRFATYNQARGVLPKCALVVCGYGVGDGKTANDVRAVTSAPMVVLTGRPLHEVHVENARIVPKGAGPLALRAAILAAMTAPVPR